MEGVEYQVSGIGYREWGARIFTACAVIVSIVVLDLWTKMWWFGREPRWTELAPLLQTVDHRNYGLIFDVPAPTWLIVGVSAAVLVVVLAHFRRKILEEPRIALAIGLVVGGALGNGYDRVMSGFVRDWILVFGRSALNVADIAIGLGLVLLLWQERRHKEHRHVDEKTGPT